MSDVIVAMSGGVDSTAAAWILKKQGHNVKGVTLRLFDNEVSKSAIEDASKVCKQLDIQHEVLDVKTVFANQVIEPFGEYYRNGLTPSPCLNCNPMFKWTMMLNRPEIPPETKLATGHYAGITRWQNRTVLRRGQGKDQSYFLHRLPRHFIERTIFPVGDIQKAKLREMVALEGLEAAHRPDSQEVCFIKGSYTEFLENQLNVKGEPGDIVDSTGTVRGRHRGLHHYTVGQRSGLGISAPKPLYVLRIDVKSNHLVVGEKTDTLTQQFSVSRTVWSGIDPPDSSIECLVQVRYRHTPILATVAPVSNQTDRYTVRFHDDVGAVIAPGQGAAFFHDDIVLGGGEIQDDRAG